MGVSARISCEFLWFPGIPGSLLKSLLAEMLCKDEMFDPNMILVSFWQWFKRVWICRNFWVMTKALFLEGSYYWWPPLLLPQVHKLFGPKMSLPTKLGMFWQTSFWHTFVPIFLLFWTTYQLPRLLVVWVTTLSLLTQVEADLGCDSICFCLFHHISSNWDKI